MHLKCQHAVEAPVARTDVQLGHAYDDITAAERHPDVLVLLRQRAAGVQHVAAVLRAFLVELVRVLRQVDAVTVRRHVTLVDALEVADLTLGDLEARRPGAALGAEARHAQVRQVVLAQLPLQVRVPAGHVQLVLGDDALQRGDTAHCAVNFCLLLQSTPCNFR